MASLTTLDGQSFKATNYTSSFTPDFTQPDGSVALGGVITIPNNGFPFFSAADVSQTDVNQISGVDLSMATSYRLGTAFVTDTSADGPPLSADILGVSGNMVLLAYTYDSAYDPTMSGGTFYQDGYFLISNTDLSEDMSSEDPNGNPNPPQFPLILNGSPADANNYNPPCFAAGTLIATPNGDVRVEALTAGDLVTTVSGESQAIVWTGSRTVDISRHPSPELVRPVRIEAGAFADNVPSRDLLVSPDHNLFVGGVLIPAKCLINGASVSQLDVATVTYHHVELAEHAVVLAEGLPSETYLDVGNRTSFSHEGVTVAHPDFASAPDTNFFAWEAKGCARLVLSGPEIDEARALLDARLPLQATTVTRAA